jgi:Fe-S cluster biogenesis protein NfuA
MNEQEIPFSFYVESTPNPASLKFISNRSLLENGASAQYNSPNECGKAPLPKRLFEFPFVKQVFLSTNYITITKHDMVDWYEVMSEIRVFITEYLNKGLAIVEELPSQQVATDSSFSETKKVYTEHAAPKNEIEVKIIEILEQYIRPAVEQDGGLISFKSFDEGKVTVQMKGSCSGCPSSTITLKSGIEGLLKRLMPDQVKEVVSEAV